VRNVRLLGVGMRDTALSYLDAHSMPSGGDWGLGRIAAVFIKGAVGTVIDSWWVMGAPMHLNSTQANVGSLQLADTPLSPLPNITSTTYTHPHNHTLLHGTHS